MPRFAANLTMLFTEHPFFDRFERAAQAGFDAVLRQTFIQNLRFAAAELKKAGLRLLIEPINTFDVPGFYLTRTDQAVAILDEVGADNPGRNEPGSGEINYAFLFSHLDRIGYDGWIGCEYKPATTTEAGLDWRQRLVKRSFAPGFRIELHQKDLNLTLSSARALGVSLPNTAMAQELFNSCAAHGGKAWDHSAMVRALETMADIEIGQKAG